MATYTITSTINIDALPAKGGSDTYTINGGNLFVDQDSRYGYNQFSGSAMGNITLSATAGGTVEFNATAVRLLPFDSGFGIVPLSNAIVSSSNGASGSLIGVYPSLTSAPLTTGSSMPSTGYLKIKQWNGLTFSSGALFGANASSPGNDVAGWIEIVGVDALTATVNRLNTFKVRGDWYDLGLTTGNGTSSYQIPNNGGPIYVPGVWVEKASGSNSFEFYPHMGSGSITSSIATDQIRGKYCWITRSGSVEFQPVTGSNTAGYLPSASLRIRIPNVLFSCCTAAARHINVIPNATLATRYDFTTNGAGVIDIDKALMCWYPSFNQPYSVKLSNVGIMTQLLVSEIASPISWSQVGVGLEAQNSQVALSMATCLAGGTVSDSVFARANMAAASSYVTSMTDVAGMSFDNVKWVSPVYRLQTTAGAQTLLRVSDTTFKDNLFGGGGALITTCNDLLYTGTVYYDHPNTTSFIVTMYAWSIASACARLKFDGLSFGGLRMVQPSTGLLRVGAAACTNIKLRNVGTPAEPLDMGDVQQDDISWSRVTTTATVTKASHGLKTGDQIYVFQTGVVAAIIIGFKTVLTAPTPDTFTFTCLNAGATTGTISYYPTVVSNIFVIAGASAANGVEIKRIYAPHIRSAIYTSDNSAKNVTVENVQTDYNSAPVNASLNVSMRGVVATPPLGAQVSVYGTHWFDAYTGENSPLTSSLDWSRITTTATVTSSLHELRTSETINVLTSSVTASILLGQKTITVTSASYFTFTCLNAGATTGTLDFVPMNSRLGIQMNESTADTADQYSIDSGTPGFTSAGTLSMQIVGQQITFTTPNYVLGHRGFHQAEAVVVGATLTNFDIFYSLDKNDGLGFDTFKNLSYTRAGGAGSTGTQTITMTNTTGVAVGDFIFGTNVGPLAYVTNVVNSTTIGVNIANIGAVSGILRFNRLPAEDVDPVAGFKMKIRIVTALTNAQAITALYVFTKNSNADRNVQYPLDLVDLTLTNLKDPSEVRVFAAGTTSLIAGAENVVSGSFTAKIDSTTYPTVDIAVLSLGYQNIRLLSQVLGDGLSIPISQIVDRQYFNS